MIDREARDKMAELLRHLASGQRTLGEFFLGTPQSDDVAIDVASELPEDLCRQQFPRLHNVPPDFRFAGDYRLNARQRRRAAETVMLLRSDLELSQSGQWTDIWLIVPLLLVLSLLTVCMSIGLAESVAEGDPLLFVLTLLPTLLGLSGIVLLARSMCRGRVGSAYLVKPADYQRVRKHPRLLCGVSEPRAVRAQTAEMLRHYLAGRITDHELLDAFWGTEKDATTLRVQRRVDFEIDADPESPACLEGRRQLARNERRRWARAVMFLYTDIELERDEPVAWWRALAVCVFLFGLIVAALHWPILWFLLGSSAGYYVGRLSSGSGVREDIWPFASREQYEDVLKYPKLLCGARGRVEA